MKKTSYGFHVLAVMLAGILLSHTVRSSDVNGAVTFTANSTARASEINANFNAVISAVNDNHARITALESDTNLTKCPPDMVPNGPGCIDRYEVSVWVTTDMALIAKIRTGSATKGDLPVDTQRGVGNAVDGGDNYGNGCPDTANGCKTFYAASVADVGPARNITWFQALATCRNAGKRLPTNQEWQMAAFGTPDPGAVSATQCNISGSLVNTGARSACVSDIGAHDMVGNMWEWVADLMQGGVNPWAPTGTAGGLSASNSTTYGSDMSYHTQPAEAQGSGVNFPAALIRGGSYVDTADAAGIFAITASWAPSNTGDYVGFRCAK